MRFILINKHQLWAKIKNKALKNCRVCLKIINAYRRASCEHKYRVVRKTKHKLASVAILSRIRRYSDYRSALHVASQLIKSAELYLKVEDLYDGIRILHNIEIYMLQYGDIYWLNYYYKLRAQYLGANNSYEVQYLLENSELFNEGMSELIFDSYTDEYLSILNNKLSIFFEILGKKRIETTVDQNNVISTAVEKVTLDNYEYVNGGQIKTMSCEAYERDIEHKVFKLENVSIDSTFSILSNNNEFIVYDKCGDPSRGFVAGLHEHFYGSSARLDSVLRKRRIQDSDVRRIDKGLHIMGRVPTNLFHVLIEYIPRTRTFNEAYDTKDLVVVVPASMPYQVYKALRIALGDEFDFEKISPNEEIEFGELYVPSFGSEVNDSPYVDLQKVGLYSNNYIAFLTEKFGNLDVSEEYVPERVLLIRSVSQGRGLLNQRTIINFAKKNGFECVDPGRLTLESQIAIFRRSKVIMGVAGAAFAWSFLCGKGTTVISFVADGNEGYSIQPKLALYNGGRHLFVTGKRQLPQHCCESKLHYFHSPFEIELRDLKLALNYAG